MNGCWGALRVVKGWPAIFWLLVVLPSSLLWAEERESLPRQISPAGVAELSVASHPFILIDAIGEDSPASGGDLRRVYYVLGPSIRASVDAVIQDRNSGFQSQRLTGTPLDWSELNLPIGKPVLPTEPLTISARELAQAIADEVDIQLVDLRGSSIEDPLPSISPRALRLFPHEFEEALSELSKRRWLVLIDDGHGLARIFAQDAFSRGYLLTTVLEGGYPAWIADEH